MKLLPSPLLCLLSLKEILSVGCVNTRQNAQLLEIMWANASAAQSSVCWHRPPGQDPLSTHQRMGLLGTPAWEQHSHADI